MLEDIKNIVFDLGGVMIDLDKERCIREFHKIGFSEIDSLIDSYHGTPKYRNRCPGRGDSRGLSLLYRGNPRL